MKLDVQRQSVLGALASMGAEAEPVPADSIEDHELKATARINSQGRSLHERGWLELGKLPEWNVFDMVEAYYAKYHDRILNLLERERPRWFEDVEEDDVRPGFVVARELSRRFESKGIFITAVHPSVSEDKSLGYPVTGPRFYVSVMLAAMRRGPAPPPPKDVARILWPYQPDRRKPWITEVGWTMVPPLSNAQAMHADIVSWKSSDPRKEFMGRFHHFIWKPDRTTNCTTGVVTSAFTLAAGALPQDWMRAKLHRVASPTVVLDSEVCHCGGPTGPDRWTASCTVQLCSSTGWNPLQYRASKELLEYTCPIEFQLAGPWVELPLESQLKPRCNPKQEEAKQLRQGGKIQWDVGSLVEAKFEDAWFPAVIGKRNIDRSYLVHWDGEATVTKSVPHMSIRARRWELGTEVEARWYGKWYPAKVMKMRSDWSYRVHWDADGTCSHQIYHCDIRSKSCSVPFRGPCKSSKKRSRSEASTDASSSLPSQGKRCR